MSDERTMPEELELSDGRVLVRPYRPSDVDAHWQAATESIAEVSRWLPWCHPGYAREESEAWVTSRPAAWTNHEELSFAITDAATGRYLGGCGLNQFHAVHRMANLGYWVRTSAAGRGAASAATVLVARYGLHVVGLQRLEILADVDNLVSQRVAEKAGARREGHLRNRLFHHRQVRDGVLFSLIADDLA